jgi:hypothetical protein
MFSLDQSLAAQNVKRLVHGVKRIARTGEDAVLDQCMEAFGHRGAPRSARAERVAILEPQFGDGHLVFGERPGFVRTEHYPTENSSTARQCDIRVGRVIDSSIARVTPPKMRSRSRECP